MRSRIALAQVAIHGRRVRPDVDGVADMAEERVTADMWFDPRCPWAWITSRWLLEVEQVRAGRRPVPRHESVRPQRGPRRLPERYQEGLAKGWGPVRVAIAAEQKYGNEVLRALYTALGTRIHLRSRSSARELYERRWPTRAWTRPLAAVADSTEYDEALRESHAPG